MAQKYLKYSATVEQIIPNAVLVRVDEIEDPIWIPRTCLAWETDEAIKRGESIDFIKVVDWWAKRNVLP